MHLGFKETLDAQTKLLNKPWMQFNAKKRERPIGHTNVILGHENGHVPYHRDHVARLPVTQKIK